jgi:hypothetical protein
VIELDVLDASAGVPELDEPPAVPEPAASKLGLSIVHAPRPSSTQPSARPGVTRAAAAVNAVLHARQR